MIYRIMTYNIQHGLDYASRLEGKRYVNFQGIFDVVKLFNPDILSVNEIYGKGFIESNEYFDQVSYLAKECNFPYFYFSKAIDAKNGEYGNAVFSKVPFIDKEVVRIPDPVNRTENMKYESRVLTKFDFKDFDLISIHVGLNEDEQERLRDLFLLTSKPMLYVANISTFLYTLYSCELFQCRSSFTNKSYLSLSSLKNL